MSRGTANTGVVYHHGKLLVLKEDSPPVVVDADSLETLDDYYTFGGQLRSLTFTAHPKIDSETGELIAFGYEARGEATDDIAIMSFDTGAAHLGSGGSRRLRRSATRLRRNADHVAFC